MTHPDDASRIAPSPPAANAASHDAAGPSLDGPPAAPGAACRNCGAALAGAFCARCGQEDRPVDPTLREMVREAVGEFTNFDGRLAATMRALLHPGRLTLEWIAGRRARYVAPLRLYLTVSVLYFFVSAVGPDDEFRPRAGLTIGESGGVRVSGRPRGDQPAVQANADLDSIPAFLREPVRRISADERGFQQRMRENGPRMFFLLVPLFGAYVALLYRSRQRRYPQHLWFALHVHAFVFLALLAMKLASFTRVNALIDVAGIALALGVPAYVTLALRRAYGGSLAGALGRATLLGVLYFLSLAVAALVTLTLTLLFF